MKQSHFWTSGFAFSLLLNAAAAIAQGPHYDTDGLDPQLDLAREIRGFGGFYIDDDGKPTVFLRQDDQRRAASDALASTLRSLNMSPDDLAVRVGQFEYLELDRWSKQAIQDLGGDDDLVIVDVDEGTNALYFGIRPGADLEAFRERIKALNIPDEAYRIAEEEPIEADTFLFDEIRPVPGGVNIRNLTGLCTLGFNVSQASKGNTTDHRRAFVTNSHCTNVQGGEEATLFGQPSQSDPIGREIDDPDYLTLPFLPLRLRRSDSARALYDSGAGYNLGAIARPIAPNSGASPTANDLRTNGLFRIAGVRQAPIKGLRVHKIGMSTGWTSGTIDRTCVFAGYTRNGRTYRFICQARTTYGRAGGDSGSPVFEITDEEISLEPNSGHHVRLLGVHWGGSGTPPSSKGFFSPFGNIENDLGELIVFSDTPGGRPFLPDLVPFQLADLPGRQGFCAFDDMDRLRVRVINQHDVEAPVDTTTRIVFHGGTPPVVVSRNTPPLQAFEFADLTFDNVPSSCIQGSCSFTISVDADLEVQETFGDEVDEHEINNIVVGQCIHID